MKMQIKTIGITGLVLLLTLSMSMLYAAESEKSARGERGERPQARGQRGGDERGGMGMFGRDPDQMQKMMVEGIKRQLASTDEEWTVIEPRLSKVMKLSVNSRFGGLRSMIGGQGGPGAQGPRDDSGREKSAIEKAAEELGTVLKNTEASQDEVKSKLAALRKEKEKAETELITAKSELVSILSLNQEATLVIMGLLD